ncbi:MAG: PilN domain-containing protein, partial [Planctomycetota bacterium]
LALSNAAGISMAVVRQDGTVPDVLNPPVYRRKFKLTKIHRIVGAAVLGLVVLIVGAETCLDARQADLEEVNGRLRDLNPRVETMQATMDRTSLSREWSERRFSWADLMLDLTKRINHSKLVVLTLNVAEDGKIDISGKSKTKGAINETQDRLKGSPFLRDVKVIRQKVNRDKTDYRVDFLVTGKVRGIEKGRKK